LRVNGQLKYVMFIHPNQTRMLRTNNAANSVTWFDIQRARVEGGDKDNPIFNGALGEYNGVILHESTRIPAPTASGNNNFYRAVLCGAQSACFATGRRDKGTQIKWVEELFDYENQLGVSASMIWGVKKAVYNSIDFSTIVVQTYAPNPQ
jgi:N4-gp56 family major capsid protein